MHDPLAIPDSLAARFADWHIRFVYSYDSGSATYRLDRNGEARYLKVARADLEPGIRSEVPRMKWAAGRLPVPRVIDDGFIDDVEWLLTAAIPGDPATHPSLVADPRTLVPLLALGLRAFHDTPTHECPFDFRLDAALTVVRDRVARGRVDPARHFHPEHRGLTVERALERLETMRRRGEDVVVCHGDYCLPNVIVEAGRVNGYVDLGELGLADRWWDLASATWSVTWNLGPGWEETFLRAYGVEPDPERTAYFRLLYDLVS